MLARVDQLTQQHDAAKNELDMARDTARTYYQRMVQAESEMSQLRTNMVTPIYQLPPSVESLTTFRTVIDLYLY